MAENGMRGLREAVQACPSGPRLAAALEGASLANSDIPALISAVIQEKLAAGTGCAAPAAAPAAAVSAAAPAAAAAATTAAGIGKERASLAGALCVIDSLMFLSPRGKQQLALFADRCVVRTPKADVCVPWAAIKHVAIIDSIPKDTKGRVLLYLHIDSAHKVLNGKTPLTALVIQTTADAQLDLADPQGGARLQGPAPVVLCQALGAVGVDPACFTSPDPAFFKSADKVAGVGANVKARQGFLYPLPSALCFLETPALFLPHSGIRSLELMRAGGSSSTFDLVVHCRSGAVHEFGMIARSEVAGIEAYIRTCRLAVGAAESSEEEEEEEEAEGDGGGAATAGAAAQARGKGKAAAVEEEDSDDDSEDEDFNPSSSSDDEEGEAEAEDEPQAQEQRAGGSSGGMGNKRKRGALAEACGAEEGGAAAGSEEDEEEEEYEEGDSSSEGSSSDSEDDGSVELVSEDDFSIGQLESVLAGRGTLGGGAAGRPKRQRS